MKEKYFSTTDYFISTSFEEIDGEVISTENIVRLDPQSLNPNTPGLKRMLVPVNSKGEVMLDHSDVCLLANNKIGPLAMREKYATQYPLPKNAHSWMILSVEVKKDQKTGELFSEIIN